jgi:L-histidine N-alpha-methyltransferase
MSATTALRAAALADAATRAFAEDVRDYLARSPRQLPSKYLYDALGSTLFDAICLLPWYRVTRAETHLLAAHGREILSALPGLTRVAELGPGNGSKLAVLLKTRPASQRHLRVELVDVSPAALETAAATLRGADGLFVVGHRTTYEGGLHAISEAGAQARAGRTLVLFLGSNIGNYDPPADARLLAHVRRSLSPGDGLLLGTDLVKPAADLQLAYDDPLGVTAAFNRNLLVRINRELEGDIDVAGFSHRAVWNGAQRRVEMHLVSERDQAFRVAAAGLEVRMGAGETIWTESSYKFEPAQVAGQLEAVGFRVAAQWIDPVARFALTLGEAS